MLPLQGEQVQSLVRVLTSSMQPKKKKKKKNVKALRTEAGIYPKNILAVVVVVIIFSNNDGRHLVVFLMCHNQNKMKL